MMRVRSITYKRVHVATGDGVSITVDLEDGDTTEGALQTARGIVDGALGDVPVSAPTPAPERLSDEALAREAADHANRIYHLPSSESDSATVLMFLSRPKACTPWGKTAVDYFNTERAKGR